MKAHTQEVTDCNGTLTYLIIGSGIFTIVSIVVVVGGYYGFWLGPETTDPAEIQKARVNIVLWLVVLVALVLAIFYAYRVWGKAEKVSKSFAKLE
jgi:uncharacterized membrane protein